MHFLYIEALHFRHCIRADNVKNMVTHDHCIVLVVLSCQLLLVLKGKCSHSKMAL